MVQGPGCRQELACSHYTGRCRCWTNQPRGILIPCEPTGSPGASGAPANSMQAKVQQRISVHERIVALGGSHATINALAIGMLLAWCALLFWYLLARFPYDGLYGQDAYAYYYQALALWREISGQPPAPGALFDAHALRWPLGY